MAEQEQFSAQQQLFEALMDKVRADHYPSTTMLNMIEQLLTPDDVPTYVGVLLERIREDEFPSISMLQRVQSFV